MVSELNREEKSFSSESLPHSQIDDKLQNINEFTVNTLFDCVSQCLQLITGDKELPTRLPPNISTRFKVCGELAQLCQVGSIDLSFIIDQENCL